MVSIRDQYGSQYLNAADLTEERVRGTIRTAGVEEVGPNREAKVVLSVVGLPKRVVLNRTNAAALAKVFGDETSDWVGRHVEVFAAPTQYAGKPTMGVRLLPVALKGDGAHPAPPPRPHGAGAIENDAVPFGPSDGEG
jgi:hypothetical protein